MGAVYDAKLHKLLNHSHGGGDITALEERVKAIEDKNLDARVSALEAAVGTFNTQAMAIIGESEA